LGCTGVVDVLGGAAGFIGDGVAAGAGLVAEGAGEVVQVCGGCCGGLFEPIGDFFSGIGCGFCGEIGQFFTCIFDWLGGCVGGGICDWCGGAVGGGVCEWVAGAMNGGLCEFFGACLGPIGDLLGNIDFGCFCVLFSSIGSCLSAIDFSVIGDFICGLVECVMGLLNR